MTKGKEFLQIGYKILSGQGDIVVVELNALDSRTKQVMEVEFTFRAVPSKPVRLPLKCAGFPDVLAVIAIGRSSSLPG